MYRTVCILSLLVASLSFFLTLIFPSFLYESSTEASPFDLEILSQANAPTLSPILISSSPFLLYIPTFIKPLEIHHLLSAAEGNFAESGAYGDDDDDDHVSTDLPGQKRKKYRLSSSALLDPTLNISRIINQRATSFMNNLTTPSLSFYSLERPQLVSYVSSPTPQYYSPHHDHFTTLLPDPTVTSIWHGSSGRLYNRVASFFVYLETSSDILGGGTHFPEIELDFSTMPAEQKKNIRRLITDGTITLGPPDTDASDNSPSKHLDEEPGTEVVKGITFLPNASNAVFWINLHDSGLGDDRTLHAGLPVTKGKKVGMNLWAKRDFGW